MKKISSITTLLFLISLTAAGQEGLVIKNNRNGKAWMYEKNARLTYILFGDLEYKTAILNDILDSSVVFGKDTVAIKRIAGIRKKNTLHHITRVVGMPLMLIGSLFMGQGAAGIYSNTDKSGSLAFFLLGAGVFSLGYIPYEMSMEDLTLGSDGKWSLEIYRGKH